MHTTCSKVLKAILVAAALVSVSANAAPILLDTQASSSPAVSAGEAPLFSNMRLNGGQNQTVAFVSDDNSILIGHYARGPWSKNEFLRSWQDGGNTGNSGGNGEGGRGDYLPPVETVTSLPEPATYALLGLGLLALGAMRRRQANR